MMRLLLASGLETSETLGKTSDVVLDTPRRLDNNNKVLVLVFVSVLRKKPREFQDFLLAIAI